MIRMIFDKNLGTERRLDVTHIFEHPIENRLSGSNTITIKKSEDFPSYEEFINNPDFTTFEMMDEAIMVPTHGSYNHIEDFSVDYYSDTRTLTVNILLNQK